MDTQGLMAALSEPFPPHAIEQREGAFGKMLDYVATETVIRRLNRVCPEWSYRKTGHEWTDPVNWTDKNGKPRTSRTLVVFGELTIPQLGTRSGTGVQVVEDGRSGEDLIKGASSDCLKNCAKLFNVGIDLYGPDLEAGELPSQPRPNLPPRARTTTQNPIPRDFAPDAPASDVSWTSFWNEARRAGLNDWAAIEAAGIGTKETELPVVLAALRAKVGTGPALPEIDFSSTRGRRMAGDAEDRPVATAGQFATPKQLKFIQSIAREQGMGDDEVSTEVQQLYGCSVGELDRRDASAYIERLQSRRNVTDIAS